MNPQKTAFITGIAGQDGAFLSALLVAKGYRVAGVSHDAAPHHLWRLAHLGIADRVSVHAGDIRSAAFMKELLHQYQPDDIYHLAAQSSVRRSWDDPAETFEINAAATMRLLSLAQTLPSPPRMLVAASANMYGDAKQKEPITETYDRFGPVDPYGVSKLAAFFAVRTARAKHGVFASNAILFNHESELREPTFVFKKIIAGLAAIARNETDVIRLGNVEVALDWGFAGDYADAMWRILQHDTPDDFMICTGVQHTIKDVVREGCRILNIPNWEDRIVIDPEFFRPKDVEQPRGSYAHAKQVLGWEPATSFSALLERMIRYEMDTKHA